MDAGASQEASLQMTSDPSINPNFADRQTLTKLPGVGEVVADRIIAGRPYSTADDLLQVPGIGPRLVERIKDSLEFKRQEPAPGKPESAPPNGKSPAPELTGDIPPLGNGRDQPQYMTRERALWYVLGGSMVSAVVAVILSLAILAGINGTLSVERQASVRQLRIQGEVMTTQLDAVGADLESLRNRLQAVEGLSGRMNSLEDQSQLLRDEMDSTITKLGTVETKVSTLSDQMGAIEKSVSRFDEFLQGMRTLFGQIFPAPEVTP